MYDLGIVLSMFNGLQGPCCYEPMWSELCSLIQHCAPRPIFGFDLSYILLNVDPGLINPSHYLGGCSSKVMSPH